MRSLLIHVLIFSMTVGPYQAFAGDKDDYMVPEDVNAGSKGSEFISGSAPDAVLMKVNIWGGVSKPGIHYVPVTTDLVTLMSYAGGPSKDAMTSDVAIRRRGKKSINEETITVNVDKILRDAQAYNPQLQPNDIVMVPESRPIISTNTLSALTVTSTLISIVLGYLAIKNQPK